MFGESQRQTGEGGEQGARRGKSTLHVCGLTDVGLKDTTNGDAFAVADGRTGEPLEVGRARSIDVRRCPVLLAVADGLGAQRARGVVSILTLNVLREAFAQRFRSGGPLGSLRRAFEQANEVVTSASQCRNRRSKGAALVAALVDGTHAHIAAVGGSRAYVLRRHQLLQLTYDRSLLEYLIHRGRLTFEELRTFPYRNIVLQAIGRGQSLWVPISRLSLRRGDRLLLCSDGLSGELEHRELRELLSSELPLDEVCRQLILAANAHGGRDNVTVVVALTDGSDLPEPAWGESVADTIETIHSFSPVERYSS